jgi:hypothetical protein
VTSFHAPPPAELEQDLSNVEHLRRDDEYRHSSKAGEDFLPFAVVELGVNSMEEMHVGHERFVAAQVVVANDYFREHLDEALDGRLSIVGHDELALWTKLVQPPLEGGTTHAVGSNDSRVSSLKPLIDCPGSTGNVGSALGRSDKRLPGGWDGEDAAGLRPEPVPRFRAHEIVSDDGPFHPEVVVMTKRDS